MRKQTGETVNEDETQNEWINVVKKRQKNHPKNPETKKKEDVKVNSKRIYCHYINNKKLCPFRENCYFLHEESPQCRKKNTCTRKYCMFQHEKAQGESKEEVEKSEKGEKKSVFAEDDNPPEDKESVEYEEYLEKLNKKLFDRFN